MNYLTNKIIALTLLGSLGFYAHSMELTAAKVTTDTTFECFKTIPLPCPAVLSPDKTLALIKDTPDGAYLANLQTDQRIELNLHIFTNNTLQFSSSGKLLFINSNHPVIFNVETRQLIDLTDNRYSINRYKINNHSAQFSSDEKLLFAEGKLYSGETIALLFDTTTGEQTVGLEKDTVHGALTSAVGSPNYKAILAGTENGAAIVWDWEQNNIIQTITHPSHNEIFALGFSPDGYILLTSDVNNGICLWDASTGMIKEDYKDHIPFILEKQDDCFSDYITSVDCSADNNTLFIATSQDRYILFDRINNKILAQLCSEGGPAILSPNGKTIFCMPLFHGSPLDDNLWDNEKQRYTKLRSDVQNNLIRNVCSGAFSPDGKHIIVASGDSAVLLSTETGKEVTRLNHDNTLYFVAFSPDGSTIITQDKDRSYENYALHLWKVKKAQSIHQEETSIKVSAKQVSIDTNTKISSLSDSKQKNDSKILSQIEPKSTSTLSFTDGVDLEDDSQKECCIQ